MIQHRHVAGPLMGLLATLVALPAFAAGRTTTLEPATAASSGRSASPLIGRFPTIQVTEPAPFQEAAARSTAPALPEALSVPPGHVAATITSIATGNWSATTTWSGGVLPGPGDDVVIADGTTVTINQAVTCANLTVGQGVSGALVYEPATARAVTVAGNITVSAGGSFQSAATGAMAGHSLSLGGSLTNNGTLDFSTNLNTAGVASITFTGAANATFGGTGGTTDIRTIIVSKGTSAVPVLELNPSNFTVRGVAVNTTTGTAMLTLLNGTFKIGGTFAGSNALSSTVSWTIPTTGALWLANPNYTIPPLAGTLTVSGTLIMDAGTLNAGSGAGNRLAYTTGAVIIVNGGTINVSGRISPTSSPCTYTQTGGVVNITTVDNASTTNSGFDLQSGSTFNMSGGTIALQRSASVGTGPRDYRNFASVVNITGGTLQLGNANSPGAQTYTLNGWAPAISITNLGGNHIGTLAGEVDAFGSTALAPNTKLTLAGQFFVERGAAINNDGTIDGSAAGSHLYFLGTTGQAYNGAGINGTVALPLANLDVDNLSTLTLNASSPVTIATRANLFTGGIVNANRLQLGVGGASTAVTQIGTAGNTTTGGSFDVAPNFLPGSGGYVLLYEPETLARTTGNEIPPSRAMSTLSVNNGHDVTLAGGDITATALSFPAGSKNLTTGANAVAINAAGTVARANPTTSGWVAGNLKKDAPLGNSTRAFEVGDAANYTPVSVNLGTVSVAGTLTGRTDGGDLVVPVGSGIDAARSVNRNWTLSGSPGLALASATGTFNFPAAEVDGGANTANFIVRKLDGSTWSATTAGTRTATSTQATWNSGFSSFAIGELASYAVNVTTVGSGAVTKSPDQATYAFGSSVSLTATPQAGWHFVGWSGDASGNDNPLNVTVDAAKAITATFAIDQYAVDVTVVGNGSVAKNPDQALYDFGSSVELTATPAAGWHFVGWSGDIVSASNPLDVTVDAAKSLTATFAANQYAVNVTVVGNGSVAKNPDQPLYDQGAIVELTATPAPGWHFAGWSGDASGNDNPLIVTVNAAKNITATFAIDQYAVDVTVVGNGSVAKDPDQPLYDSGSSVELTAAAATGWHFVGWSGDASGNDNPLIVTVDEAKAITATFAINQYALNVAIVGNGTVAKVPDQALYDHGTEVELTATPAPGYHFVAWSGDIASATNPLNVAMVAELNLTATFAINQYAVNVSVVGSGSVAKNPDQPQYDQGAIVELTATPAPGWHFAGWSGDATGNDNPLNVTVNAAKNITATFAIDQYAVDVTVVGNGSVAKDPDQPLYDSGSSVELTATAATGWHFVGWSGDASGNDNPLIVTVDEAKAITATFAINQYAVNVSVIGSGSVTKVPDQPLYDYGSSVELTATPATGWHFVGWSGDASGNDNPLNVTVDEAKAITATFAINQYAVDVTIVGSGSVAKNPDQLLYDYGSTVELTATAAAGWHFVGWSGDASGNDNPLNVTVDAAKNITATFAVNTYTLAVAVVGSGSVAADPAQASYDHGASVQLTATANPGWTFSGWSGDASGNANPLTVVMNADKSITATFVDAVLPTAHLLAPNTSGEVMVVGTTQTITWTASDNVAVTSVALLLSRTGNSGPYEVIANGIPNTGSYDWIVTGPATADGVISVLASDAAGNAGGDTSDEPLEIVVATVGVETPVLRFALLPVVPSPSVTSARLRYELPKDAQVDLSIVDVRGREVAKLVHGMQPAGRHVATWNGQTPSGRAPAGVYFARCLSAGARFMQRIVLIR